MEHTHMRTRIIIFWVIVALIIGALAWQFYSKKTGDISYTNQNTEATSTSTNTNTSSNTQPSSVEGYVIPGTSVVVTQPKPQKVNAPAPSLSRALPDTSTLDASRVQIITADIQKTISNLQKDPTSFQDWINLGFDRKTLGDYEGAREAWEYVSLLYPQNLISFSNLGDLYTSFLKDFVKAESAYKTAIKNAPTSIDAYRNLFNLYVLEHKNAEAVAILKDGIVKNPTTFNLQILLARYYRDAGNVASATLYYDQAISIAQKNGDTTVATALTLEKSEMK